MRLTVLLVAACLALAALPAAAMKLITTYAEDPLVGGKKVETDKIQLVPGWGRVAGDLPGEMSNAELQEWVDWAQGLKGQDTLDIIHAVNDRVNKTFRYQIDQVTWGETVYQGLADSVARDGSLLLRQLDGSLIRIVAGDVTLRH